MKTVQDTGFTLNRTPGMFFYDFIINSNPAKPEHRELLNPTVREAFEYAIDRQQIINVALGGYGTLGDSIVPPADGAWHDPSLKPLPFDIAKANELLDWTPYAKGSDGIRVADGHPMAYTVIVPNSREAELSRTFQIMQPDFQQIGVKLSLKILDPSAAFDAIGAPNYKYKDFDLAMWDWIPAVDPARSSPCCCATSGEATATPATTTARTTTCTTSSSARSTRRSASRSCTRCSRSSSTTVPTSS